MDSMVEEVLTEFLSASTRPEADIPESPKYQCRFLSTTTTTTRRNEEISIVSNNFPANETYVQ